VVSSVPLAGFGIPFLAKREVPEADMAPRSPAAARAAEGPSDRVPHWRSRKGSRLGRNVLPNRTSPARVFVPS
jgi:hypothetical protein